MEDECVAPLLRVIFFAMKLSAQEANFVGLFMETLLFGKLNSVHFGDAYI